MMSSQYAGKPGQTESVREVTDRRGKPNGSESQSLGSDVWLKSGETRQYQLKGEQC